MESAYTLEYSLVVPALRSGNDQSWGFSIQLTQPGIGLDETSYVLAWLKCAQKEYVALRKLLPGAERAKDRLIDTGTKIIIDHRIDDVDALRRQPKALYQIALGGLGDRYHTRGSPHTIGCEDSLVHPTAGSIILRVA
jgi:hypothetical protein